MNKKNLNVIKKIVSDATDQNIKNIKYETKSSDIFKWDSLAQIKIISSLEKIFKKKINTTKAGSLKSIMEISKFIDSK
tara:strand:+ start:7112 stop:7345 length:234 start_codon:yes stop_codon:yes gene_type:complete